MIESIFKEEVFRIIDVAIDEHTKLGSGLIEGVYQKAIELEFMNHKIPFISQKGLAIQ